MPNTKMLPMSNTLRRQSVNFILFPFLFSFLNNIKLFLELLHHEFTTFRFLQYYKIEKGKQTKCLLLVDLIKVRSVEGFMFAVVNLQKMMSEILERIYVFMIVIRRNHWVKSNILRQVYCYRYELYCATSIEQTQLEIQIPLRRCVC